MSSADAAVVREMWEEFASHPPTEKMDNLVESRWHPEITYEEDPRWPGAASYSGRDRVLAVWEGYREILGPAWVVVEDVIDAGDQVVAIIRVGGTSPAGAPWDHLWGYLCRVENERLAYFRAYWESQDALAAAGVSR